MHALRVIVDAAREDEATAALWEAGTQGVEVKPALERGVELLAYFGDHPDIAALARALPGASIAPAPVPEVDWVARFREGFRPFRVGRFEVVPRWEAAVPSPERLIVDPGRAFGTGTHETTKLESMVPFLATTGSAAPFIGLFGTVMGILFAFMDLSTPAAGSDPAKKAAAATLDKVGPHIAEALFATAIGLVAAIPAVMAFNYFMRRIKVLRAEMDTFSQDYLNIIKRHFLR